MLDSFHRHAQYESSRTARSPDAEIRAINHAMKELGRHGFDGPTASSMKAATVAQGRKSSEKCQTCEDRPGETGSKGWGGAVPSQGRTKKDNPQTFVCGLLNGPGDNLLSHLSALSSAREA